jgi:OFA family oxalate/formate antiporter-like MFS transporter
LHDKAGSWLPVFAIIITMDALTGILALVALKPLRKRYAAK